ncbi:MAG: hypothetical protein AAF335_01240 [Bacteroidota bacterium]
MPSKRSLRPPLLHLLLQAISTASLPLHANLLTTLKKTLITTWVVMQVGKGLDKSVIHTLGQQGAGGAIQINAQGHPIITTVEQGVTHHLTVTFCDSLTCANHSQTVIDNSTQPATPTSLQLSKKYYPVITYFGSPRNEGLKIAFCHDLTCYNNTLLTLDNATNATTLTCLQLDDQDHPLVAYCGLGVKLALCHDPLCNRVTLHPIDPTSKGCTYLSLKHHHEGYAIINYADDQTYEIKVVKISLLPPPIPTTHAPTPSPTKAPLTIHRKREPFPKKQKKQIDEKDFYKKMTRRAKQGFILSITIISCAILGCLLLIGKRYKYHNTCQMTNITKVDIEIQRYKTQ